MPSPVGGNHQARARVRRFTRVQQQAVLRVLQNRRPVEPYENPGETGCTCIPSRTFPFPVASASVTLGPTASNGT